MAMMESEKEKRSPWLAISFGCCASSKRDSIDEDEGRVALRANGMLFLTVSSVYHSFSIRMRTRLRVDRYLTSGQLPDGSYWGPFSLPYVSRPSPVLPVPDPVELHLFGYSVP